MKSRYPSAKAADLGPRQALTSIGTNSEKRMPTQLASFIRSLVSVAAATLLLVASAHASEVSFTGGFTSFAGTVATRSVDDPAVLTLVNGVTVFADQPIPGLEGAFTDLGLGYRTPISLLDGAGQPIPSVDFRRHFYFSQFDPNVAAFEAAAPVNVSPGSVFTIGTFTLTNGGWFGNNSANGYYLPDTDLGFSITTHSADPLLDGIVFTDTLRFVATAPSGTDFSLADDADYFYFLNHPELGTMSVIEALDAAGNPTSGNVGTVSLTVRIGSLIPVGLSNPTGGAFIGNQVSAVPEPAAWLLWLAGGMAVTCVARHKGSRSRSEP
jgi:hypothetical protein